MVTAAEILKLVEKHNKQNRRLLNQVLARLQRQEEELRVLLEQTEVQLTGVLTVTDEILDKPIGELWGNQILSKHAKEALDTLALHTLRQIREKTAGDLLRRPNFGQKSHDELERFLQLYGQRLKQPN